MFISVLARVCCEVLRPLDGRAGGVGANSKSPGPWDSDVERRLVCTGSAMTGVWEAVCGSLRAPSAAELGARPSSTPSPDRTLDCETDKPTSAASVASSSVSFGRSRECSPVKVLEKYIWVAGSQTRYASA